jgi:hypothetical protein
MKLCDDSLREISACTDGGKERFAALASTISALLRKPSHARYEPLYPPPPAGGARQLAALTAPGMMPPNLQRLMAQGTGRKARSG